jgi:hypothetical protein
LVSDGVDDGVKVRTYVVITTTTLVVLYST